MSKILKATCGQGAVKVDGLIVDNVEILSEGIGESEGALLLEKEKAFYIPKTVDDLSNSLENLSSALDSLKTSIQNIGNLFTAIGAGMTGPTTAPPPTLASDVTAILSGATELETIKAEIDQLKDNLK